jgi:endonuclease/exonuclease/phosphatase family metal-dependent hydrolase
MPTAQPLRFTLSLLPATALLVGAGACGLEGFPLGFDDADGFSLADSPNTLHLADALEQGGSLTFRDLFEKADALTFTSRPDPTALLIGTNTLDDNRSVAGRQRLTVLSYNVALLDVSLFGFVPYSQTPDLEERRRVLPGRIFATGHDIILLQEVWDPRDVDEFTRRGREAGYLGFAQGRFDYNDGLITFIKRDILAGGSTQRLNFDHYAAQDGLEFFPGPGIRRGWLAVRFIHATLGPIAAFNTHMQAWPENWFGRMSQSRELGIQAERASQEIQAEEGRVPLLIAGGDFNSGPYYKEAAWKLPGGGEETTWFHNTLSYATLLTYGDMVDLAIMGRPAADATADVLLGNTVVNDADRATEIPGADAGWCDRTPHTTFTASDCNSLYFDQYAGTEYPARLDHIFARDPAGRIVVTDSRVVFTEKERFGAVTREPSDHYGVLVDLLVRP